MSGDAKICNICDDRHITKQATDWCSECDQAFCSECKEYHAVSRASKSHTTISIADYVSLKTSFSTLSSVCMDHSEIFQIFCPTHDKLLCHNCLEKHNGCKGIVSLTEITKNVKSSTNFKETQQDLIDTNENITKIQHELKLHLGTINDDEKKLMTEITTTRKKVNDHLDKLEDDLRKDLSKEAAQSRNAINELLQKLDDRQSEITKTQQQMKDLETYASDFQTFLSLKQISSVTDSSESFVQAVAKDGAMENDTLSLNVDKKIEEIVRQIKQFGMVEVQKKPCHVPLIRRKDKQAQLVGLGRTFIKSVKNIKLNLVQTIDTQCRYTCGCAVLSNGKMAFSNYTSNGCVCIFDSDGKHLSDIPKKHARPSMDLTCIDSNTKVAISSGTQLSISIVDINKPEVEQKFITTQNACYGLAYSDESLMCCILEEGIQKISLDGKNKVSTIVKFDLGVGYIAVHNNKLYYTDRNKHSVTCSDMEGQLLWTFRDETVLKKPCGISVDTQGFVYVVSKEISSVVVLAPDGQDNRVLLSHADGLKSPLVLYYDRLRNRLLVANEEDTAFLFDVSV